MNDTDEDRKAIQDVIDQIMVYPLSEFDGEMKTIDWSELPDIPAPAQQGSGETKWVVPGEVLRPVRPRCWTGCRRCRVKRRSTLSSAG